MIEERNIANGPVIANGLAGTKGLFITGTDTGVGKTFVSAALIRALCEQSYKVAGLKPIASGFEEVDGRWQNDDVEALRNASNVDLPLERVNRYGFEPAIAPHIAAEQAEVVLSIGSIRNDFEFASSRADFVVVEGVGGWHVPLSLNPYQDIESLAVKLALPVVLVVGMRLGCLNHAVLTARAIQNTGLPLLGWVANHVAADFAYVEDNIHALKQLMPCKLLFEQPFFNKNNGLYGSNLQISKFLVELEKDLKNS